MPRESYLTVPSFFYVARLFFFFFFRRCFAFDRFSFSPPLIREIIPRNFRRSRRTIPRLIGCRSKTRLAILDVTTCNEYADIDASIPAYNRCSKEITNTSGTSGALRGINFDSMEIELHFFHETR